MPFLFCNHGLCLTCNHKLCSVEGQLKRRSILKDRILDQRKLLEALPDLDHEAETREDEAESIEQSHLTPKRQAVREQLERVVDYCEEVTASAPELQGKPEWKKVHHYMREVNKMVQRQSRERSARFNEQYLVNAPTLGAEESPQNLSDEEVLTAMLGKKFKVRLVLKMSLSHN